MIPSRLLLVLIGLAVLTLSSACDAGGSPAMDDAGVYTLEQPPASDQPVAPPEDPAAADDQPAADGPPEPSGEPDDGPARAPADDDVGANDGANDGAGRAEPSGSQEADESRSPEPASGGDEGAPAEPWEHQPLAEDSPELVAFQREVVALPAGYDGSLFTPPGREDVTVANRYTDRFSHDAAVAFMREALEDAGWAIVDRRDARRDTVQIDAVRGTETAKVLVQLGASPGHAPDLVAITVEHTA